MARAILAILAAWLLASASLASHVLARQSDQPAVTRIQDAGARAWRAGDRARAEALWRAALDAEPSALERARLTYNLGNAAYRRGALLEAVGWYTASLRLAPRGSDARANLEFVRAEAGLEPADRGDLSDTVDYLTGALTRAEAEWLAAIAAVLLALALLGEAMRGGAMWRGLALFSLCAVPLAWIPLGRHLLADGVDPVLVIAADGLSARSEPTEGAERLLTLSAGEEFHRIDALPGWVRVRAEIGEVWVREDGVFALSR